MSCFLAKVDSKALQWAGELSDNIQVLSDNFLLLESAVEDLDAFYQACDAEPPKVLRRVLALLRHVESSLEATIDESEHLCDRVLKALEKEVTE